MPLINSLNQTDFRTLKFSNYTNSPPSVIVPIPDSNGEQSPTNIPGYDSLPPFGGRGGNTTDYFRGGAGLPKSIIADEVRIGNLFFKNGSFQTTGNLFIAKQNQLSLASVRTQASSPSESFNDGTYTPVNTLLSVAGIAEGVYLPKQLRLKKYSQLITNDGEEDNYSISGNDTNRLVQLVATKIGKGDVKNTSKRNTISKSENAILGYIGGPSSALGVGRTRLYFAGYDLKSGRTNTYNPNNDQTGTLTLTSQEILAASSSLMSSTIGKYDINPKVYDFRKTLRTKLSGSSNIISDSPDYDTYSREKNFNLGDPGNPTYNRYNPNSGIGYSGSVKALDKITAFPLYKAKTASEGSATIPLKDIVKFRIASIDNDNPAFKVFTHFRAFINSFSDTYSPEWNGVKYVGRGDSLYRYGGFTRTMQLDFEVVAQSVQELLPMFSKLNFIASNTMPDYSSGGYMRAPLIELTIGDYLVDHAGFISSLTYTPNLEAGFDINTKDDSTNKELPRMMKVSMGFTPIPDFVPRKLKGNLVEQTDITTLSSKEVGTDPKGYIEKFEHNYFGNLTTEAYVESDTPTESDE
jgi:hypothetical protein